MDVGGWCALFHCLSLLLLLPTQPARSLTHRRRPYSPAVPVNQAAAATRHAADALTPQQAAPLGAHPSTPLSAPLAASWRPSAPLTCPRRLSPALGAPWRPSSALSVPLRPSAPLAAPRLPLAAPRLPSAPLACPRCPSAPLAPRRPSPPLACPRRPSPRPSPPLATPRRPSPPEDARRKEREGEDAI